MLGAKSVVVVEIYQPGLALDSSTVSYDFSPIHDLLLHYIALP